MGQKVNPILFRLGNSTTNLAEWSSHDTHYSHFFYQEIEIRKFLENLLRSRGVLLRSCQISRSSSSLFIHADLYFSYILTRDAKSVWARSFFKTVQKKYTKVNRIKDVKNFVQSLKDYHYLKEVSESPSKDFKRKFQKSVVLKKAAIDRFEICSEKDLKAKGLSKRNKFFFFLISKKKRNFSLKKKEKHLLLSAIKNNSRLKLSSLTFVRVKFAKFNRLFSLRKLKYNFKSFSLKNTVISQKKNDFSLLDLTKKLCKSLQSYTGIEEIHLKFSSFQLSHTPSFKIYKRKILKELMLFQRNRELSRYFSEFTEAIYFVLTTFGSGNAALLGKLLGYFLEKSRKQVLIIKFIKKCLSSFFELLPPSTRAIEGLKIQIRGRFNKRRRTKKFVFHQGQISLQTLTSPLDYSQSSAITLYGSFGIKVWISKRRFHLS